MEKEIFGVGTLCRRVFLIRWAEDYACSRHSRKSWSPLHRFRNLRWIWRSLVVQLLSVTRLKVWGCLEYCIDPKIEGIYSRKSLHSGDEKVGHIYSPRVSLDCMLFLRWLKIFINFIPRFLHCVKLWFVLVNVWNLLYRNHWNAFFIALVSQFRLQSYLFLSKRLSLSFKNSS